MVYTMSTKKEATRLRLLNAARKLLEARGFHGVSLEDIAEAAGVSRQAVYKSHFASKAELLLDLVQHVHVAENLDELTRPVFEAPTALAMLEETIGAILKIEARLHDLALLLSTAALTDAGARAAWQDRLRIKRGAMRNAIDRVAAEGRLSSAWTADEALDILAALLSVDTYHALIVERGWQLEALISRVWAVCQSSFLVEPSPCEPSPESPCESSPCEPSPCEPSPCEPSPESPCEPPAPGEPPCEPPAPGEPPCEPPDEPPRKRAKASRRRNRK